MLTFRKHLILIPTYVDLPLLTTMKNLSAIVMSTDFCLFSSCQQASGCQILDILYQSCNCGIPDLRDALER